MCAVVDWGKPNRSAPNSRCLLPSHFVIEVVEIPELHFYEHFTDTELKFPDRNLLERKQTTNH